MHRSYQQGPGGVVTCSRQWCVRALGDTGASTASEGVTN
jgi:hypothetical protein